eukprot:977472-Pelagomonas_calceolata.AAC.3
MPRVPLLQFQPAGRGFSDLIQTFVCLGDLMKSSRLLFAGGPECHLCKAQGHDLQKSNFPAVTLPSCPHGGTANNKIEPLCLRQTTQSFGGRQASMLKGALLANCTAMSSCAGPDRHQQHSQRHGSSTYTLGFEERLVDQAEPEVLLLMGDVMEGGPGWARASPGPDGSAAEVAGAGGCAGAALLSCWRLGRKTPVPARTQRDAQELSTRREVQMSRCACKLSKITGTSAHMHLILTAQATSRGGKAKGDASATRDCAKFKPPQGPAMQIFDHSKHTHFLLWIEHRHSVTAREVAEDTSRGLFTSSTCFKENRALRLSNCVRHLSCRAISAGFTILNCSITLKQIPHFVRIEAHLASQRVKNQGGCA